MDGVYFCRSSHIRVRAGSETNQARERQGVCGERPREIACFRISLLHGRLIHHRVNDRGRLRGPSLDGGIPTISPRGHLDLHYRLSPRGPIKPCTGRTMGAANPVPHDAGQQNHPSILAPNLVYHCNSHVFRDLHRPHPHSHSHWRGKCPCHSGRRYLDLVDYRGARHNPELLRDPGICRRDLAPVFLYSRHWAVGVPVVWVSGAIDGGFCRESDGSRRIRVHALHFCVAILFAIPDPGILHHGEVVNQHRFLHADGPLGVVLRHRRIFQPLLGQEGEVPDDGFSPERVDNDGHRRECIDQFRHCQSSGTFCHI